MASLPNTSVLPKLSKRKYWLYVLKLENEKYYIGITSQNVNSRMNQHINGFAGARWTRKYKPIKLIDKKFIGLKYINEAEKYEQAVTMKYVEKYGLKNVRGGWLTYDGEYHKLGNSYFEDHDFEAMKASLILMMALTVITVLYFLK